MNKGNLDSATSGTPPDAEDGGPHRFIPDERFDCALCGQGLHDEAHKNGGGNAAEKFKLHDMVKGAEAHAHNWGLTVGLVVGFSTKNPECVRVLRAGHNHAEVFHMDMWEIDLRATGAGGGQDGMTAQKPNGNAPVV